MSARDEREHEHDAIARYLGALNATSRKYRRSKAQEFTAQARNVLIAAPGWPSNHSRVLAYMLARDAGCGRAWGSEL